MDRNKHYEPKPEDPGKRFTRTSTNHQQGDLIWPTHGYCSVCKGEIPKGVQWTLTGMLNRVHSDPDDCIKVLHPTEYSEAMKANPTYISRHRYVPVKW